MRPRFGSGDAPLISMILRLGFWSIAFAWAWVLVNRTLVGIHPRYADLMCKRITTASKMVMSSSQCIVSNNIILSVLLLICLVSLATCDFAWDKRYLLRDRLRASVVVLGRFVSVGDRRH